MAIDPANANPPTNPLRFQDIIDEFGENSTKSLGGYRMENLNIGGLTEIPLDGDGCGILGNGSIPVDSQEIKFSDFYNSRLNVLVDCYTSNQNRVSAKDKYTAVSQPGNFRIIGPKGGDNSTSTDSPPSNTGGKKITILVNKEIGSQKINSTTVVALRTGTWTTGTDLRINVRNGGLISGAGGDGGTGGPTNVPNGGDGTSAIGIEYVGTTKLIGTSGAKIQRGYAGGGGGGWASGTTENGNKPTLVGQGSGGGGGAGIPAGSGGQEVAPNGYPYADGNNGFNGSALLAGNGGAAGGDINHGGEGGYIGGGAGGRGADSEQTALGGNNGEAGGTAGEGEWQWGPSVYGGGSAGGNGYAIVKTSNKTLDTSGYAGSLIGGTQNANPT
tara:strand:- start:123 stop:1280 length:1158 start_codon:yes stop_codon:yes gene_type:complete